MSKNVFPVLKSWEGLVFYIFIFAAQGIDEMDARAFEFIATTHSIIFFLFIHYHAMQSRGSLGHHPLHYCF
jgi:hypothetical protein